MLRRDFLRLLGAGAGIAGSSGLPVFAAPRRKPTFVVLTDVTPDVPLIRFADMLGTLLAKGLPVTCVVHTRASDGKSCVLTARWPNCCATFCAPPPGSLN